MVRQEGLASPQACHMVQAGMRECKALELAACRCLDEEESSRGLAACRCLDGEESNHELVAYRCLDEGESSRELVAYKCLDEEESNQMGLVCRCWLMGYTVQLRNELARQVSRHTLH